MALAAISVEEGIVNLPVAQQLHPLQNTIAVALSDNATGVILLRRYVESSVTADLYVACLRGRCRKMRCIVLTRNNMWHEGSG